MNAPLEYFATRYAHKVEALRSFFKIMKSLIEDGNTAGAGRVAPEIDSYIESLSSDAANFLQLLSETEFVVGQSFTDPSEESAPPGEPAP
jgi:hypothetical protein